MRIERLNNDQNNDNWKVQSWELTSGYLVPELMIYSALWAQSTKAKSTLQADLLEQSHQEEDISEEYDLVPVFSSIRNEASWEDPTESETQDMKAKGEKNQEGM